jgi:EAL domain-containing protein (putative c-di-GMP-specific phosphodiesterase class I)
MGLPATAEGIETSEVLEALNRNGCEIGQGYYFGKAMPAADITALLQASKPAKRARRGAA